MIDWAAVAVAEPQATILTILMETSNRSTLETIWETEACSKQDSLKDYAIDVYLEAVKMER